MSESEEAVELLESQLSDGEELLVWHSTRKKSIFDSLFTFLAHTGETTQKGYIVGVTDRAFLYIDDSGECVRHARQDVRSVEFTRIQRPILRVAGFALVGLLFCVVGTYFRLSHPFLSFTLWTAGTSGLLLLGVSYKYMTDRGLESLHTETSGDDSVHVTVPSDLRQSIEHYMNATQ